MELIAWQLQTDDESGSLFIGDLIIHLMRRAGESILPILQQLLEAMATRMTTAKTATFIQASAVTLIENSMLKMMHLSEFGDSLRIPHTQRPKGQYDLTIIYFT